jgi:hypothetical protein
MKYFLVVFLVLSLVGQTVVGNSYSVWVTGFNVSIYVPTKSQPIFTDINCVFKGNTSIYLENSVIPYDYYFCQNNNQLYSVIDIPDRLGKTILSRFDSIDPLLQSATILGEFSYNIIVDYTTFLRYPDQHHLIRTYATNSIDVYKGTKLYLTPGLHWIFN